MFSITVGSSMGRALGLESRVSLVSPTLGSFAIVYVLYYIGSSVGRAL